MKHFQEENERIAEIVDLKKKLEWEKERKREWERERKNNNNNNVLCTQ